MLASPLRASVKGVRLAVKAAPAPSPHSTSASAATQRIDFADETPATSEADTHMSVSAVHGSADVEISHGHVDRVRALSTDRSHGERQQQRTEDGDRRACI